MPAPQDAAMPPDLDLDAGYTLRLTAVDPGTGALVAGVNVTSATLTVELLGASTGTPALFGDWFLIPGPGA